MLRKAKEALLTELSDIYGKVTKELPAEPARLQAHLSECNTYFARVAQLVADSEWYHLQKRGEFSEREVQNNKPMIATFFREIVNNYASDEQRILTLSEKLFSVLDKRIES